MSARWEQVTGRYLHLELEGLEHRVYVEQAGKPDGVPLLCLHTAGADARQFRGLLNDQDVLDTCHVIAFDLPYHGKSSPPAGWQHGSYELTAAGYAGTVLAIITALGLHRPIVLGCSIGGRLVLYLAADHPELVGGVIGLQSGGHVEPYYDTDYLNRPDVHGGLACAGIVSGLIGPQAPEEEKWETLWHYMQGGPGVFKGDLHFYKVDGDVRGRLAAVATDRCPVFLLTGEYDYSCSPEDTLEVAKAIPGAQVTIMPGLGHFPMSEDYASFRRYLRPALTDAVAARSRLTAEGES
jgi:pimeloyl-ACP methyl ester carboxylesterase